MSFEYEEEHRLPTREVKEGIWFRPFDSYAKHPYEYARENYFSKTFTFTTPDLGEWVLALDWEKDPIELVSEDKTMDTEKDILILEGKDMIVHPSEISDKQKEFEVRIVTILFAHVEAMEISTNTPLEVVDALDQKMNPWELTVRIPSGYVYKRSFYSRWSRENKELREVRVVDVSSVIEQIEAKIERAHHDQ